MSQSYNKPCMYCKERIEMSDKASGNWLPYNLDGCAHDCKTQNQNQNETGTKKVETISKPLSLEELDARLKRVESIVIGERK